MDQNASARIDFLEEVQQFASRVTGEPVGQIVDGVVLAEDVACSGQLGKLAEDRKQVLAIGVLRMRPEIQFVLITGAC